jgi:hypothetical protein
MHDILQWGDQRIREFLTFAKNLPNSAMFEVVAGILTAIIPGLHDERCRLFCYKKMEIEIIYRHGNKFFKTWRR